MARPTARKPKWQKIISWITLLSFTLQPSFAAAQVVADTNAAAKNRPAIEQAQNGTTVVQIATPSAAGISRNLYQQFDIDKKGLILNNAFGMSKTELAGYIMGNNNLKNGAARIILNEVTGTNISQLQGYLEIAGQKADVIIANPNGIMGNGFGFINTGRAVLTTGVPIFGGSGSLEAFRVTNGTIAIEGNGIDATRTDKVDLISRALTVNAGIWAKDLNVVTGANQVNAATLTANPLQEEQQKPQVAIDVSNLGGMYAGKIKLVGTEKGVGVNSKGTLSASSGNLSLNNEGQISLSGTVSTAGDLHIDTKDAIVNKATIYAKQNANLQAANQIENQATIAAGNTLELTANQIHSNGTLAAGIQQDGTWGQNGNLQLNAKDNIQTNGKVLAKTNLQITANQLNLQDTTLYADQAIHLKALDGDINSQNSQIGSEGNVQLTATGAINNQNGKISADNTLTLQAQSIENQAGTLKSNGSLELSAKDTLQNQTGQIEANQTKITAKRLDNQQGRIANLAETELTLEIADELDNTNGNIGSNGTIDLKTRNLQNNNGQLIAKDTITMMVEDTIDNTKGKIISNSDLNLTAEKINNQNQGNIVAKQNTTLNIREELQNNTGIILAEQDLNMIQETGTIANNQGIVQAGNNLTLQAENADIAGGEFSANGDVTVKANNLIADKLIAGKDLMMKAEQDLTINQLAQATKNMTANAKGKITNAGNMIALEGMQLHSKSLENTEKAAIKSGKKLELEQKDISNQGTLFGEEETKITAEGNIDNTKGKIISNGALNLTAEKLTNQNGGNIVAKQNATLYVVEELKNDNGIILADKDLSINQTTGTITNNQGVIQAGNDLTVQVEASDVIGGEFSANGAVVVEANNLTADKLIAGKDLTLTAQQDIKINQLAQATKNLTAKAKGKISNAGNMTALEGLQLDSDRLENAADAAIKSGGKLELEQKDIHNQGILFGDESAKITAEGNIDNSKGKIISNGDLNLTAKQLTNQDGNLVAKQNATLHVGEELKNDSGIIIAEQNLNISQQAGTITNQQGIMQAGNDLTMQTENTDVTGGEFSANGNVTVKANNLTADKLIAGKDLSLKAEQDIKINQLAQATKNLTANAKGKITNAGNIIALEGMQLDSDSLENAADAAIKSGEKLELQQKEINNQGTIFSKDDLTLEAQEQLLSTGTIAGEKDVDLTGRNITSTGTLIAGLKTDGNLGDSGNITIAAEKTLTATGKNIAGKHLTLQGDTVILTGAESYAGQNAEIIARTGNIDNSKGNLSAGDTITLNAKNTLINDQGVTKANKLQLNANNIQNQSGTLLQYGQSDLAIYTETLDNTNGQIATNSENLSIEVKKLDNSQGQIQHAGNGIFTLAADKTLNNTKGKIIGNQVLKLKSQTIENTQGTISAKDQLNVQADKLSNKSGTIVSNETVDLRAKTLDNTSGKLFSQKDLQITSESTLNNTSGEMAAGQNLTLELKTADFINNKGTAEAGQNFEMQAKSLQGTQGKIAAQENVVIDANKVTDAGSISTGKNLTLKVAGNFTNGKDGSWKIAKDFTLNAGGTLTNAGTIEASGNLNLHGQNVENAAGGTLTANETLTITANNEVKNSGSLFGKDITIDADKIANESETAAIAATNSVNLYVKDAITNSDGALIYSMGDINIAGSEEKNADGNYKTRAKTLTNQSANIEADQDIVIYADYMVNKKSMFEVEEKVISSEDKVVSDRGVDMDYFDGIHIWWEEESVYNQTVLETTIIQNSSEAKIIAQKNVFIQADVAKNEYSSILAGKKLNTQINILNNIGLDGNRITTRSGVEKFRTSVIHKNNYSDWDVSPIYEQTIEDLFTMPAIFGGGKEVNIQGTQVNNTVGSTYHGADIKKKMNEVDQNPKSVIRNEEETSLNPNLNGTSGFDIKKKADLVGTQPKIIVENEAETIPHEDSHFKESVNKLDDSADYSDRNNITLLLPSSGHVDTVTMPQTNNGGGIILPKNGLYNIKPDPTAKYLVETNAKFTNLKTFISSDYLLDKIGHDPAKTMKRLGDGFYEQKLVRDQITELTGRSYLDGNDSVESQYQTLLQNAANNADDLNLNVGIALTAEQQAALTQDIVWLVEQEVSGQKVLVPVVYLSALHAGDLKPDGAIITADRVNINVSGDVHNTSTIQADEAISIHADNVRNIGGTLDSGNLMQITAEQDILNLSGNISGTDITLRAGNNITSETYQQNYEHQVTGGMHQVSNIGKSADISAEHGLTAIAGQDMNLIKSNLNAGTDMQLDAKNINLGVVAKIDSAKFDNNQQIQESILYGSMLKAGERLNVTAKNDLNMQAAELKSGKDMSIQAGHDLRLDVAEDTQTYFYTAKHFFDKRINQISSLESGGSINLTAGTDMDMQAAEIKADKDISLQAGGNLQLTAVANTMDAVDDYDSYNFQKKNRVKNQRTQINAKNNLSIISNGDMNLTGVQATGDRITATSGGNMSLGHVKDVDASDIGKGYSSNYNRNMHYDETNVGTDISASKEISMQADGDITFTGSSAVSQQGKVELSAGKDITLDSVTEKHESLKESKTSKSGFLSKKTTFKRDYSLTNEVVGSMISGDSVQMNAGNDITLKASSVVGTNDVTLKAGSDINLETVDETGASEHYSYTKKSGLFSGGGFGFTIGSKSEKSTLKEQILARIGSTIGSIDGNVTLEAGNAINGQGATLIGGKDISLKGKEINLDNSLDLYDSQYKYEFKQSGLSVSLGGVVLDTAFKTADEVKRSGEVQDDRLKTLYAYKAVEDLQKVKDELAKNGGKPSIGVNISIGSTKTSVEQITHIETVNPSNVTAGGNVNIQATEKDINLKGTNITAGEDITLKAKQDINIDAAQNKQQIDTKTSSSSWSVGGTIGSGAFANFSKGSGKENQNAVTHTGSTIDAKDTLNLESGNDTNITGSKVEGDKVEVKTEGDLNIASLQDTDDYNFSNKNIGGGFGTGKASGTHGSIGKGKTDSTYQSVTDQAGIYAGQEGFDIEVGKNTDLKGAVISSEAEAVKNALTTGTLTFTNLENRAEYTAKSSGVNYNAGRDANGNEIAQKDKGFTPAPSVTANGDASSTTKSAIAPGTIEIRNNPNQDLSGLSRNTEQALNALGKIFDKKKIEEQQELAGLFGELAFKAIGDLGLKEGSPEKIALDSFAGGIMAKLGGGDFASGAAGAGINQLVMNELKNIKDPAVMQWASALVGSIAAKIVGGDSNTGASTAVSETKNNWLGHEQYDFAEELAAALESKDEGYMKAVLAKYYAMSNYNSQNQLTGEGDDERITESLYPLLDCLISKENKDWLKGGLNYALGKIINTDPEMVDRANYYRNQLEQSQSSGSQDTVDYQKVAEGVFDFGTGTATAVAGATTVLSTSELAAIGGTYLFLDGTNTVNSGIRSIMTGISGDDYDANFEREFFEKVYKNGGGMIYDLSQYGMGGKALVKDGVAYIMKKGSHVITVIDSISFTKALKDLVNNEAHIKEPEKNEANN
ncbi:hemagglutinin repeat-containing protein [Anaerosinus massiliensis]|uniref:hemagglutinin repeat-containing protein n=1 Tax=Massilibacillus massiliensis TaxID=1806837 RepID=UPI000A89E961|nr:hemagglutinin repeat-containing protein [Massilibacillus massiliensis]